MKVYGHRGAPCVAPENTPASFEAACEMGCYGVECDVHFTADKQLVVIHTDYELDAMWGLEHGVIENTSLSDIKKLRLNPKYTGFENQEIPTLDEFYELMKKYPTVHMNVELKTQNEEFYEKVVKTTSEYGFTERVIYSASKAETLGWFGVNHPELPFSVSPVTIDDADFARGFQYGCKCAAVQPYFKVVTEEYVKGAHDAGLEVIPWTVDTQEEMKRLISIGVDGIISNIPSMVLEFINGEV